MTSAERCLAGRYARALFACAAARQSEAAVAADLAACVSALAGALPLLRDPRVSAARKKALVRESLGGAAAPLTADFLEFLIEKKRFALLPALAGDFDRLMLQSRGVVRARVRAARPLSEADRARLRQSLEKFAGTGVELDVRQDPELLGGVTVRLGDWVLDSSLRGQLQSLKEAIGGD
ncbi:MAG: ATP synthase F1 subunit delta [Elusimicrobia bacterium]|nr:ATP synthase F1 subunit delta [Elusimicrobiota bacterium]